MFETSKMYLPNLILETENTALKNSTTKYTTLHYCIPNNTATGSKIKSAITPQSGTIGPISPETKHQKPTRRAKISALSDLDLYDGFFNLRKKSDRLIEEREFVYKLLKSISYPAITTI